MKAEHIKQALEAINTLDQAASAAPLTRGDHVRVQMSSVFLRKLLEEESAPKVVVAEPQQSC